MPDTDPTPGPGPFNNVVVTVVDCADHTPIILFSVSFPGTTVFVPYNNGTNRFVILNALPGQLYRVASNGYDSKESTLTAQEVKDGFAEICLDFRPPTTPPPKPCIVASAVLGTQEGDEGSSAAVLSMYRRVRDEIALTARGRDLVARYYDERVSTAGLHALEVDDALARDVLGLLVEITPHVSSLFAHDDFMIRPFGSVKSPVFSEEIAAHALSIVDRFRAASGLTVAEELDALAGILRNAVGKTSGEILMMLDRDPGES